MSRFTSIVTAAVLAGAALMPTGAVTAASRPVSYADLDLTTADGRATIDARIHDAAGQLCRRENTALDQVAACSRESVAAAQVALDHKLDGVQIAAR